MASFVAADSANDLTKKTNEDATLSTSENSGKYASTMTSIAEAWSTFCRQEDSQSIVEPSAFSQATKNVTNAAKLGQYFASEKNASHVVKTAIELLANISQIHQSNIFLEPSCGDGRILDKLLQSNEMVQKAIVGIDIDPISIQKAKQKLGQSDVILKCADFLSLDKDRIFSDLSFGEETRLVVIGGPPYTPKSLPEQFILHSIVELNADIVVFILPSRSAKDADKIQKTLNNVHSNTKWCYDNTDLDNISFSFKETTVSQPSILQSWYKRKDISM